MEIKKNEEFEIINIFKFFYKKFRKLTYKIISLFKRLVNILYTSILFLLFLIYKHKIKYLFVILLTIIYFVLFQYNSSPLYKSSLIIRSKDYIYNHQIYSKINGLNNLALKNDSAAIQNIFSIDVEYAKSIKRFNIEPIVDEITILSAYLKFDSILRNHIKFEAFYDLRTKTNKYNNYELHKIIMFSSKENVFKNIEKRLLTFIQNNIAFKEHYSAREFQIEQEIQTLMNSIKEYSELKDFYLNRGLHTPNNDNLKRPSANILINTGGNLNNDDKEYRTILQEILFLKNQINQNHKLIHNLKNPIELISEISQTSDISTKNNLYKLLKILLTTTSLLTFFLIITRLKKIIDKEIIRLSLK